MDLQFEVHPVDDQHIYIIFKGQASGLIHFNNYNLFEAFFEGFLNFTESYTEPDQSETLIPQPTLAPAINAESLRI
jgi:hypothetical protein